MHLHKSSDFVELVGVIMFTTLGDCFHEIKDVTSTRLSEYHVYPLTLIIYE